jgi:hypothetical protein
LLLEQEEGALPVAEQGLGAHNQLAIAQRAPPEVPLALRELEKVRLADEE